MTEHSHSHETDSADPVAPGTAARMWDEKYSSRSRMWSGEPNPQLVA